MRGGRPDDARGRARQPDRPPRRPATLVLGSHLDTVTTPAATTARSACWSRSRRRGRRCRRAVEVVGFADEEGVRFRHLVPRLRRVAGRLRPRLARRCATPTASRWPTRCGVRRRPRRSPRAHATCARYFEVHIEQGPVLERRGEPLGVVTAITGQTHADVAFVGEAGHAGHRADGRAPRRAGRRRRVDARRRGGRARRARARSRPSASSTSRPARAT